MLLVNLAFWFFLMATNLFYTLQNPKEILNKLLDFYNQRGAEYPAEHNVGHEYKAKKSLVDFYKKLDPTNSFNPGIGNTSKSKYWN